MKASWYSVFPFIFFVFRTNGKKEHLDENDFRKSFSNYFKSAILKVTWYQPYSKFFLNNYEAHWERYLNDILQLKILRSWMNMRAISFVGNYHETEMNEGACTKIWDFSSMNIAQRHFTYYCIFLFPQTYLVFKSNLVLIE